MNRSLRFGLAAFIAATALTPAGPSLGADEAKPELFMPEMRKNFGTVFEADTYDHAFVVGNRGKADLVIEDVKPGCGCTATKWDKVIAPGAEGKIELSLDGKTVHGGAFEKFATVTTNDPAHRRLRLAIVGSVIPFVDVKPADKVYLQGRYGERVEKHLTLTSNEDDLDFSVTRLESTIDDKITYKLVDEGGGRYGVRIWKNPKLPTTNANGSLYIHTNSERSPVKTIQVQVITKGSITVSPTMVNFGRVQFGSGRNSGAPVRKNVTLIKSDGEFAIMDVEFSDDAFTGEVEPVIPGKRYKVKLSFTPPPKKVPKQQHTGEMTVHTNDPREPAIRVRLVARSN